MSYKNYGQCVSWLRHHSKPGHHHGHGGGGGGHGYGGGSVSNSVNVNINGDNNVVNVVLRYFGFGH